MLQNITLSAEKSLIAAMRDRAREERTTLNNLFRKWMLDYTTRQEQRKAMAERHLKAVKKISNFSVGRKLTRDEMNAR